jgi:hypothetical protein
VAAPKYVPVAPVGAFRDAEELPVPDSWLPTRPAELGTTPPTGRQMGRPGPDQGYALVLARRFEGQLGLLDGEDEHDVIAGCLGVALKRAALFGRAPVIHDLEVAFSVFGFLGGTIPTDLRTFRVKLFQSAGHHYEQQRAIADLVPESTLRMTPGQVKSALGSGWRKLLATGDGAADDAD